MLVRFRILTSPKGQYLHTIGFFRARIQVWGHLKPLLWRYNKEDLWWGKNRPPSALIVCSAKRRALCKCNICRDVTSSCFATIYFCTLALLSQVLFTSLSWNYAARRMRDHVRAIYHLFGGILIFLTNTHDILLPKSVNNFLIIHVTRAWPDINELASTSKIQMRDICFPGGERRGLHRIFNDVKILLSQLWKRMQ